MNELGLMKIVFLLKGLQGETAHALSVQRNWNVDITRPKGVLVPSVSAKPSETQVVH